MFRNKFFSVVLFAAMLAVVFVVACKDKNKDDPGADGTKAAKAMCDCVSKYTVPTDPTDYEAFMAYVENLYQCLGEIAPYSNYVTLAGTLENGYGFDPNAETPLYSVFAFKNADFEKEFKKGTEVCMLPFAMLLDMLMSGGQ